ncbi:MAG: hypothetical protein J0L73_10410 [Verrucomicrobia bacterium]|nr:hypothetical protein [Verrucomicrobiota bacterium]
MTPEVRQAVEGLYNAFAAAKRPACLVMSPVKDPADFATLLTTPLRELTAEQLWQYSFSLFFTVGDIAEFEYFFPRIMELASESFSPLQIEVVFQKTVMAGWPDQWRKDRQKAFQTYLEAMAASWASTICNIDAQVCALARCLPDIDRHLGVLMSGSDAANENLLAFYEANCESIIKSKLSNSFWERSSDAHSRVVAWLQRADVQQRIQQLAEADLGSSEI